MASSSLAMLRKNPTEHPIMAVKNQTEKELPTRRSSVLKPPRVKEEELRKVRSVKSRVRFTAEDDEEVKEEMARDESMLSIG